MFVKDRNSDRLSVSIICMCVHGQDQCTLKWNEILYVLLLSSGFVAGQRLKSETSKARQHGKRFHTTRLDNADCFDLTKPNIAGGLRTRRSGETLTTSEASLTNCMRRI